MTNFIEQKTGFSLENQREVAKMGLAASLAGVALSAFFMKNPAAKSVHIASGVALIAFSLWHHSLYPKNSRKSVRNAGNSLGQSVNSVNSRAQAVNFMARSANSRAQTRTKMARSPKK